MSKEKSRKRNAQGDFPALTFALCSLLKRSGSLQGGYLSIDIKCRSHFRMPF
jgi:hypothetical protein